MWREVRRVPAYRIHPKRINKYSWAEEYQPAMDWSWEEAMTEYHTELEEWVLEYSKSEWKKYWDNKQYDFFGYYGDIPTPPSPKYYMPSWEWFQLYENVSEWSPLSPPFEKQEELVEWLSNNKDFWWNQRTRKQAEAIVASGFSFSWWMIWWKILNSAEMAEEMSKKK
jgi:hypothetical protein